MEIKIQMAWGKMRQEYIPKLNEYFYTPNKQTIHIEHIHQIFVLQEELKDLKLNTTFTPSLIIEDNKIFIYDDYIE
jgi:hypothetical protein